jgi:hypothetical protein
MTTIRLTSLLLLTPALCAQGVVSPLNYANAEGNTYDSVPFGTTITPYRYLQVHDDLAGTARPISALVVRRDGNISVQPAAAYVMVMDVILSSAATTASTMSTTFDNNHGANRVQVASFHQVSFPATTAGPIPRPFEYRVPLPAPYQYNGQGGLCWEVRLIARQGSGVVYHNGVSGSTTNPAAATLSLGAGCKAGGRTSAVQLSAGSQMNWPQGSGLFSYTGYYAPANSFGILALGTSPTSFSGIPLPFEIPSTRGQTSGVCYLYNSWAFTLPLLADNAGVHSFNLGVPATQEFYGARIFGQGIFVDTATTPSNPLGVVTSNGVEHNWVPPYASLPVGRVHLASSTGPTGTANNRHGLVVRFE